MLAQFAFFPEKGTTEQSHEIFVTETRDTTEIKALGLNFVNNGLSSLHL